MTSKLSSATTETRSQKDKIVSVKQKIAVNIEICAQKKYVSRIGATNKQEKQTKTDRYRQHFSGYRRVRGQGSRKGSKESRVWWWKER